MSAAATSQPVTPCPLAEEMMEERKKHVLENFPAYFFNVLSSPVSVKGSLAEIIHSHHNLANETDIAINILPMLDDFCTTTMTFVNGTIGWWPAGGSWSFMPRGKGISEWLGNLCLAIPNTTTFSSLDVTATIAHMASSDANPILLDYHPVLAALNFTLPQLQRAHAILSYSFICRIRDAISAYATMHPEIVTTFGFVSFTYAGLGVPVRGEDYHKARRNGDLAYCDAQENLDMFSEFAILFTSTNK